MGEVTISAEEYKKLLGASVRIDVFADFVNAEKYSISRENCGQFLGFKVKKVEED